MSSTLPVVPMPLNELADRYTIATLKLERLGHDEPAVRQAEIAYYAAGLDFSNEALVLLLAELKHINGQIWDLEASIRAGEDESLGYAEIGRRAIKIRDTNRTRIAIKNRIAALTGSGFADVKVNYAAEKA